MHKNIIFIRHGKTKGNTQKRYIGITNEDILSSSKEEIKAKNYPKADKVYSSPLNRCLQTASIIYPNISPIIIEDFKETNFGDFENKNYLELSDNIDYQKWIDSNGTIPFPNGEDINDFKNRCINAFYENIIVNNDYTNIAIITHGGTIMAILEHFSKEKSSFYDWQIENSNGFCGKLIDGGLKEITKLW